MWFRTTRQARRPAAQPSPRLERWFRPRLEALERVVFGAAKPNAVIVTTPNGEYNVLYETLGPTLPDGLAGAAALWGLAQKAFMTYPEAVTRAGHRDGNALFEIFVKTECGVEIVSSRYRQIRPRFGPIKGFDVSGSDRLELPVHEPGWDGPEVLRQAQLEIARQIFPEPVGTRHTRKPTDDELIENLKVTLIERAKHKSHHHYILIGDDTTSPSANFCARLLDELPGLSVIHVPSSGGETALLVDNENELLAIIREFLKIPETEQRKR